MNNLFGGPSASPAGTSTNTQSYTILRIKRKRNEEPLDALVVEARSRRKKSRNLLGGVASGVPEEPDVFQFAQTVEEGAWEDELKRKLIQDEITRLASGVNVPQPSPPATQLTAPVLGHAQPQEQRRVPGSSSASLPVENHEPPRKYTVVMDEDRDRRRKVPTNTRPTEPPKIVSASAMEAAKRRATAEKAQGRDWKVVDAVLQTEASPSRSPAKGRSKKIEDTKGKSRQKQQEEDEEMAKFMPMLSDYLRLNDIDVSSPPATSTSTKTFNAEVDSDADDDTDDGQDYVYDVFYRRPRAILPSSTFGPADSSTNKTSLTNPGAAPSLSAWNSAAIGFGLGTGVSLASGKVATLVGFDGSDDDDGSDGESEEEDEADEDSNDEGYYKNDYPEEEDAEWRSSSDEGTSDEFHEDSEDDDFLRYDDDSDHDWR